MTGGTDRRIDPHRIPLVVAIVVAIIVGVGGLFFLADQTQSAARDARESAAHSLVVASRIDRLEVGLQAIEENTENWSPIVPYRPQRIIAYDGSVVVTRPRKCIDPAVAPIPDEIVGSVTLQSVPDDADARSARIFIPLFAGARAIDPAAPPCIEPTFTDELPAARMRAEIAQHIALGERVTGRWRIVGTEYPRKGADVGTVEQWQTDTFVWPLRRDR